MNIFKISSLSLFLFLAVLAFPLSVRASLVVIDKGGSVVWKVLSIQDSIKLEIPESDYLEVTSAVYAEISRDSKISLLYEDGRFRLKITTDGGERNLDVTEVKDGLVEIEERPEIQRLKIGIIEDKFSIEQKGIVAVTSFPISIDPQSARISISTPSGDKFLSILPQEAVNAVLRSKVITQIEEGSQIVLEEGENREPAYIIEGERIVNIFNVINYSAPVKASVSASTGELLLVEQPTWLKILGFLFT